MSLGLNNAVSPVSVLTSGEMMDADQHAIHKMSIPSRVLMEHAAMACVKDFLTMYPHFTEKKIFVFSGKGNNGGDGVVIARILAGLGASVRLISLFDIPQGGEELAMVWDSFKKVSSDYCVCTDIESLRSELSKISRESILIDAITGSGFSGSPRGFLKTVVEEVNRLVELNDVFVCSVDIPSGNSPDEGFGDFSGIKADCTWALQCLKPVHVNPEADMICGEVVLLDIGIPGQSITPVIPRKVISRGLVQRVLLQVYPESGNSHKGDKGHVLIVGGSKGKEGAPVLSCLSALKAGAGLVTLVRPSEKKDIFVPPEIMQKQVPDSENGTFGSFNEEFWSAVLEKKDAIVVGPGMGTDSGAVQVLEYILRFASERKQNIPLVIDADAITSLAMHRELMKLFASHCILTPHYGEFSRLTGKSVEEIKRSRLSLSYEFSRNNQAVLLLKGPYSVISNKEAQYINYCRVPSLGVAGSGDILSGILGAFLAKGITSLEAAIVSVFLHTEAARLWEVSHGASGGMLASEVTGKLPEAVSRVLESDTAV